jgi:hypothetical protein
MKYTFMFLLFIGCSKDISFDPATTIGKELIRFIYNESIKEGPVME